MRLVRAMVLTLCELLAAVSHQLPTVSRGIGARDRWILPNLHLHAIRAALVVPTQEQEIIQVSKLEALSRLPSLSCKFQSTVLSLAMWLSGLLALLWGPT